jgi:hypothetical protein
MYFYHNNDLAWISIAKNACRSWAQVFDNLGWQKEDLFQPQVDIQQLKFFGLLRWPAARHTMGVIEYLEQTNQCDLLYNTQVNRLLVSAVFDQHSYTVSQMIPADIVKRTEFFIIDQTYYNYEVLVRNYLHNNGVEIVVPAPRVNIVRENTRQNRIDLEKLKQQYPEEYFSLEKNFLNADFQLYRRTLQQQQKWHRPGDPGLTKITRSDFYPWLVALDSTRT